MDFMDFVIICYLLEFDFRFLFWYYAALWSGF